MKLIILSYSESYFKVSKFILVRFYQFSCIQDYYKRIAFQNAYETSIIFQPFLYASDPPNLRLMHPLSLSNLNTCIGIFLPSTLKMKYVNMQHVNVQVRHTCNCQHATTFSLFFVNNYALIFKDIELFGSTMYHVHHYDSRSALLLLK